MVGMNALSAPVFRNGSELAGMIGVVGSMQDIASPPGERLVDLVRGAAAQLSATLQGTPYRERGFRPPREMRAAP
jgi:DNA-binding IclR family transcriptional regulator